MPNPTSGTKKAPITGDLLFYQASSSWIDQLIVKRTGSKWVHVAIQVTQSEVIQAVSGGVQWHATPPNYGAVARVGAKLYMANPTRFDAALMNLGAAVGQKYGFGDWVDQLLMLLPGSPAISFDRSEDCSDLAVEFLQSAGYALPFATESDRITPGGLFVMVVNDVEVV